MSKGVVQCGACDYVIEFDDLPSMMTALESIETAHNDGNDDPCEALNTNGEHLLAVGHKELLIRVRENDQ